MITVCGRICFKKKHPLNIQRFQGLNILIFVAAGLECHLWQMPGFSKLFRRRVVLPGNSLMECDDSGVVAMALFFFFGWGEGQEQLSKKNNMNSSTYSMNSWSMFIVGILNMKSWHIYGLVIVKFII